ncbi:MAG: radical SAM protein [Deltaproteobacteria bacterium]|nr:radical SAM protein [Deltaproteobacteria bacterium]
MEPDRQIEIQLGHMCNNRCVFCVSGQRTERREALPLAGDPVIEKLREGRARGLRKLTLLGGEPTIQPEFMRVLRAAVDLAYEEIVIFTNGAKTARASFVDEILETGGNFTFRLSFQGATARAHERTTKKLGSFARLVETMGNLRDRGQRITVNMCVVRSNFESVADFPALLLPYGVQQLHLDMIRPLDAGERTEDEMRAMLPRYSDLVPHLEAMVAGFPAGFDVNIGNLPYCVAPAIAPVIHHDGETTFTVSVDAGDDLSEPWDKYQVKARDKVKLERCRECVFDDRCSGVYDTYRRIHGTAELQPVTRARLPLVDPEQRLFTLHAAPLVGALRAFAPSPPFSTANVHVDTHEERVTASFARQGGGSLHLELRRPGGGAASTDRFSLHLVAASAVDAAAVALLREVFARLCAAIEARVHHGVGPDAAFHGPARELTVRDLDPRIGACLSRLRDHAPFGALRWEDVTLERGGRQAAVALRHEDGTGVTLSFAMDGARVRGSYRLDREVTEPPASLVEGVRAAMMALRGLER